MVPHCVGQFERREIFIEVFGNRDVAMFIVSFYILFGLVATSAQEVKILTSFNGSGFARAVSDEDLQPIYM